MIDRRSLLLSGFAAGSALSMPGMAFANAATDRRFLFIIQRGAADGLGMLAPLGDPAFASARGDLAAKAGEGLKLDSLFTLHPALTETGRLFAAKQARFVHAIASGYRDRSHFDGQNILETAATRPYGRSDGWLNRLVGLLPAADAKALAIATAIPPALRGPHAASSYAPSNLPDVDAGLMERVAMLYAEDRQLAPLWASATQTEAMASMADISGAKGGAAAGTLIASLMAGPNGARIAMVESNGWDTHVNQEGRLTNQLKGLDAMVASLRLGMGTDWNNMLVLVATEFGRTVHVNGTRGTDHGTASAAMFLGGALANGGQVTADWPGLAASQLYEGRDLKPTTRFESAVAAALAAHYSIEPGKVRRALFPDYI